ncbi:hypothetical protein HCQ94_03615 [Actinomyces sp. zg-332]|uniref:hypothetical protein n=1 Tax=Actinomyces sp. zg-332 TaxID=2708340 RepID=UPI0018C34337|nr:hypothetical protein [Actinomyces sp. zg-332]QPK93695.1 hypothetical protein HCQ94_03615 [Actinomyces sp. zg-332]
MSFFALFISVFIAIQFFIPQETVSETAVLCQHLKKNITVSGNLGTVPVIEIKDPILATNNCTEKLITSNGKVLKENDPVLLAITVFDSKTGDKLTGDNPKIVSGKLTSEIVESHVYESLLKTRVGERIATYLPVTKNDRLAGEVSIIDVLPLRVLTNSDIKAKNFKPENTTFTKDKKTGEDLPVDVKFENGKPSFGEQKFSPEKSAAYILIKGEGKQISKNSSPITHYLAKDLQTGKIVDTTYETGVARKIDFKHSYEVIAQLLADEPVGSRVLLYLTGEDTDGKASIAIVVDILALEK